MRVLISAVVLVSAAYSADFTTYIGDANQYQVFAVATDAAGNTYVTGSRLIQLPVGNPSSDVFVTKLDAAGTLVFTTTFGGKGMDQGYALAVDALGNIWAGGYTSSTNFPLHDSLDSSPEGNGFLVKLAPDGTVIYSSYFDGTVQGLVTDARGNVYVTGTTDSSDFPVTPGLPAGMVSSGGVYTISGAFVTRLDPTGSKIVYSALIAGTSVDCSGGSSCFLRSRMTSGAGIALDAVGDAFIAGFTNTSDLPVTEGGAGYGGFVAKIDASGNKLDYLTYLDAGGGLSASYGPGASTDASAIAVDPAGNAYVTGSTTNPAFPATVGAYQTMLGSILGSAGPADAFAIKLDSTGKFLWATFLGGPGNDSANAIGVDGAGNVWLTGFNNAGFPTTPSGSTAGVGNFLSELSPDGSKLLDSSELNAIVGRGLAIDPNGVLHVAGESGLVSTITPRQPPNPRITGIVNAATGEIAGRIAPGEVVSIYGFGIGPATAATAVPRGGKFPDSLAGVQVLVNGVAIPLLYVSASQINAEIPLPVSGAEDGSAIIRVVNPSTLLPGFPLRIGESIFGIFSNPDGSLAAVNQDGSLNSEANPAKAGSYVSVWATGFNYSGMPLDGSIATTAVNWCGSCALLVGSLAEIVEYAGAAPGLIDGIMQINFIIPVASFTRPDQLSINFNGFDTSGFIWVSP